MRRLRGVLGGRDEQRRDRACKRPIDLCDAARVVHRRD